MPSDIGGDDVMRVTLAMVTRWRSRCALPAVPWPAVDMVTVLLSVACAAAVVVRVVVTMTR
jgi:hypothetical protein